jgi:hypothetical protein
MVLLTARHFLRNYSQKREFSGFKENADWRQNCKTQPIFMFLTPNYREFCGLSSDIYIV